MSTIPPEKPITTRRELENRIIAKAWRDPAYKARLLKDPKAVLQEEISQIDPSVKLPEKLQVQVHEESPTAYHMVLPRNPKDISLGEVVGDNDLEAIAPQTIAVVLVAAVGAVVAVAANNVAAVNAAVTANAAVNANAVHNANLTSTVNAVA